MRRVQSVSGGGHWGGGVFIHAEDQARIGQLVLQDGIWDGQRLLPAGWVAQCRTPCALNPAYGLLWWLNTGRAKWPSASAESYSSAVPAGTSPGWTRRRRRSRCCAGWTRRKLDGFMAAVGAALRG